MAQSVELLFDDQTDTAVRGEWDRLAAAGLPSSRRTTPSPHHGPHLTLYAADAIDSAAEPRLRELLADLDLGLALGAPLLFGPRRGRCVFVRSVLATSELLALQATVAEVCEADPEGQFGRGRWSPHVTLAPRLSVEQVASALTVLGELPLLPARSARCRRWDGTAKTAWLLTSRD